MRRALTASLLVIWAPLAACWPPPCSECRSSSTEIGDPQVFTLDSLAMLEAPFLDGALPAAILDGDGIPTEEFLAFVADVNDAPSVDVLDLTQIAVGPDSVTEIRWLEGPAADLLLARVQPSVHDDSSLTAQVFSPELWGAPEAGTLGPSFVHASMNRLPDGGFECTVMTRQATSSYASENALGSVLSTQAITDVGGTVVALRYCATTHCGGMSEALHCLTVDFSEPCSGCDASTPLFDALAEHDAEITESESTCQDMNQDEGMGG